MSIFEIMANGFVGKFWRTQGIHKCIIVNETMECAALKSEFDPKILTMPNTKNGVLLTFLNCGLDQKTFGRGDAEMWRGTRGAWRRDWVGAHLECLERVPGIGFLSQAELEWAKMSATPGSWRTGEEHFLAKLSMTGPAKDKCQQGTRALTQQGYQWVPTVRWLPTTGQWRDVKTKR